MQLQIKYLKLKNFLSYGSEETRIDFECGMTAIISKNGQGKSSLVDSLSFCLYGKPYRSIKISELINRTNKKNLLVECEFTINGKDVYKIIRGIKPNIFKIIKNGEDIELLSAKSLNQKELDKIIGVDYLIFKQTISLAISYNQPFLILEAKDKRKMVEQIFGLSIFGKMNEQLKNKIRDTNKSLELCDINIKNLFDTAKLIVSQINEMKEIIKNFEINRKSRITDFHNKITNYEKQISEIELKQVNNDKLITKLVSKYKKSCDKVTWVDTLKLYNKQKESEVKYNEVKYLIRDTNNKLNKLDVSDKCPTCNSIIDNKHKLEENNKLKKIIEESNIKLNELENDFEFWNTKLTQEIRIKNRNTKIGNSVSIASDMQNNYNTQIKSFNKQIEEYRNNIEQIKEEKNEVDIIKLKNQYDNKKLEHDTKKIEKENLKLLSEQYKITSQILSDDGVKSYIIDKVTPILNLKINEFLDIFEIPLKIVFDRLMEAKIITMDGVKETISYYSCSEGEKKRIDFAILLSIIETLKIISNWNSNILIIDELLDSSIDEDGLDRMLATLKQISEKKNMGIMIISHRNINSSYINNTIKIKKVNGFSQITEG